MWEIIQSGGPMMVPLIACAILAIAYSIERLWIFGQLPTSEEAQSELDRLETALRNGGEQAVVEECNQGKGLLNYVFASLLKRYDTLMIEQREFKETNEEIIRLADAGGGGQVRPVYGHAAGTGRSQRRTGHSDRGRRPSPIWAKIWRS